MRRTIVIVLSLAVIIYLIKINNYLYDHFENFLNYREIRDLNREYENLKKFSYPQQYSTILLIVLDGATRELLYDERTAENIVNRWRKNGIRYKRAFCMLPSVSAPNYLSIISGAPPYIHGAINNNRRFPRHQRIRTIFDQLTNSGISSAVIGFSWYKDILKGRTEYYPVECCESDDSIEVTTSAIRLIEKGCLPSLTLLHYLAPDNAGHRSRSNRSDAYVKAITEIDKLMEILFQKLDERYPDSLVIIMSDHGMNIDGNHGGREPDSLMIPLYCIARDIESREIERPVYNLAIAPTLATLFGIPSSPFASGSILHEIVDEKRKVDSLSQSIEIKQRIVNSVRRIESSQFAMGEKLLDSLINRDVELTRDVLSLPEDYRSRIMSVQRIFSLAVLLVFFIFAIYKAESGLPLIIAINMVLLVLMGLSMQMIDSRHVFDIAMAIYIILLIVAVILYRMFLLDFVMTERMNEFTYVFRLLEFLLPLTIIIAGFFIPFYTYFPDENIFAFRFYQLSFLQPFFFSLLLYFVNRV